MRHPVRPPNSGTFAREEFYRRVDQLTAGRPVAISGLDIHEAVWYLNRPNDEIENCTQVQLAAGVLPPPTRVLVLREDFLARHIELQEKYIVLGSKLTTRDTAYAVLSAK